MALNSFRDANPYLIGAISVAAIAGSVALAFAVGVLNLLEDTYQVTAVVADSAGITSGDDVRVAGVKAGRVTSVEADRDEGNVKLELAVNSDIDLGPNTEAEVTLETLLGTKYVRLSGPVQEPFLEGGAVIPIERTRVPFDVFELSRIGTEAIQETDTERLNLFVDQLANVSEDRRQDLQNLLEGLRDVAGEVNDREDDLQRLFERVETISGTLAEKDRVLVRLLDQSQGVLDVLEQRRQAFSDGLEGTETLTAQLASLTTEFEAVIDSLLDTVHETATILDERQEDLDRALAYIGPGTLGLAQAVNHGPWADIFASLNPTGDPSEQQ